MTAGQYLRLVRRRSATSNGVSAVKLHAYQLRCLQRFAGRKTPAQLLQALFPNSRYFWLTRRDKAAQAISLERAISTHQWWSLEGQGVEQPPVKFDPLSIAHWEAALDHYETIWAEFFRANAITPIKVTYEDLRDHYETTVRDVLSALEIPETIPIPPPRLQRQANIASAELRRQYQTYRESTPTLSFPSIADQDPIEAKCADFSTYVPPVWKEWIAQARRRLLSHDAMLSVLVRNGYTKDAARAAISTVTRGSITS